MFKLIFILFFIQYSPLHNNLTLFISALLTVITIYLIAYFRTLALKHRADALERSVFELTRELAQEKENVVRLLEQNNERLSPLSHKFRAPITLTSETRSTLLTLDTQENLLNQIEIPQEKALIIEDTNQAAKKTKNNRITNHIPLLSLTARHHLESKLKSWYYQVDEYSTKPYIVEELAVCVKRLLTIRNMLENRQNQTVFTLPDVSEDILDKLTDTCVIEQINKQKMFVDKLNAILEKHYTDSGTSVYTIANAMAMSERQFFRKLKSVLGRTPIEHLKRFRLKKACFLLAQGQSAISTALDSGFSSQSYFGKCFKNEYGYPPSDFQKRLLARNVKKLLP